MNPVEQYFTDIRDIHASGAHVAETSFYPALVTLLNAIGHTLSPRVRCIMHPKNTGGGLPDAGLFTADQFKRRNPRAAALPEGLPDQSPARGVIEIKGPNDDVERIAGSTQIEDYWRRYGLVLVTNYRAFALVGRDTAGQPVRLESFTLALTADAFWRLVAHPRAAADQFAGRLTEYLVRVLLHNAPLTEPQDVAAILASYARDARFRVEHSDLPALAQLRQSLEETLGLHFDGPRGDHFFRSTLVQTLFYGVFSAWVLWARRKLNPPASFRHAIRDPTTPYGGDPAAFDWRDTAWLLRVPIIRALFEQIATPTKLAPLGLTEVLNWTATTLNRVDLAAFFAAFDEGHAVQYFYEPFLEAFDPELRKDLGVWYTPGEIVRYQVERVDTALREELHIADGLADPRVVVLDPCCGTGAYLVAVLHRIAATLHEKGGDALVAHDLKTAARDRVFGFEILPAPFVIAHLQLGLLLETHGAPLDAARNERAGVYLTNALTGWEPPKEPKTQLLFPEMAEERDAAEHIKQTAKILVILGNPPYNGFAGMAMDEERDLSNAYRTTQRAPAPQGQGLNDLYVRFFRMAERRIVEMNGQGVVCYISNYSWLDGLSFTGMRERYLEAFDGIRIDCLNGDKYKTGKLTPEGDPDPSVFSTDFNREGIQVGTAIATLVRTASHTAASTVQFRHFWGKDKRNELLSNHHPYEQVVPVMEMGLSFMPGQVQTAYFKWPLLPDLFPVSFPGVKTSRDDVVVDIDRDRLDQRMRQYFDPSISHEEMRHIAPGAMTSTNRFKAEVVRDQLRKRGYLSSNIVRYCYRPFDVRWLYWEPETKLLDEKRSEYFPHVSKDNVWLEARQRQPKEAFDRGFVLRALGDNFGSGLSNFFPLYLHAEGDTLLDKAGHKPNLSSLATSYAKDFGASAQDIFFHVVAVLHAPAYRMENAGALRQDWPRIPLPKSKEALLASAALGRQVAALLDTEAPVPGVTEGKIRDDLKRVAVLERLDGRPADPAAGDLDITAGWGHGGKGGVTMPGRGRIVEADDGATLDIYLNDAVCWRRVPKAAWEYTIGGYQVIKKWLSYREQDLLGRGLTVEEARYVTEMTRRLTALLTLHPSLDENYRAVAGEMK